MPNERMIGIIVLIIFLVLVLLVVASCVKIVPQAKAFVIEQLGAYKVTWEPACILSFPLWRGWQEESQSERAGVVDFPAQAGNHQG